MFIWLLVKLWTRPFHCIFFGKHKELTFIETWSRSQAMTIGHSEPLNEMHINLWILWKLEWLFSSRKSRQLFVLKVVKFLGKKIEKNPIKMRRFWVFNQFKFGKCLISDSFWTEFVFRDFHLISTKSVYWITIINSIQWFFYIVCFSVVTDVR